MASEKIISVKYEEMVTSFYNKVKKDVANICGQGVHITQKNMVLITNLLMKEAGKVKNLVGWEKKMLVVKTYQRLVDDKIQEAKNEVEDWTEQYDDEFQELQKFVDTNLDPLVDQLFALGPKMYGKVSKKCCMC